MIIHAISDLHGNLPPVPPCDVLLIAGDIVPLNKHGVDAARGWLDVSFRLWLENVPANRVVAIWGNHDFIGEVPSKIPDLPWTLLHDEETEVAANGEALRIYGTPWTPLFGGWAFMREEYQLDLIWQRIPVGVDVLLVHGPANRILDKNALGEYCGSKALREHIDRVRPRAVVHGHIHEAHGRRVVDGVKHFNVSLVNAKYQPVNPGITFSL